MLITEASITSPSKIDILPPLTRESVVRLGRAKSFTQLDLTSSYHRMRLRESDERKTAFSTRYSHFEDQIIPFGLSKAPASFQDYVNKILTEKLDIFVIVYLDDILSSIPMILAKVTSKPFDGYWILDFSRPLRHGRAPH